MPGSDAPYLVILFYHTLSVLVIWQPNSKNSRRALFICKYPQLCSPKVKINFKFRFPCLIILLHQFLSFSHQKRWILSLKFQWIIFAKTIPYHFGGNRTRTLLTSPFTSKLLPLRARNHIHSSIGTCFDPCQIRWFTGPSLPPFPFCLLSPCHMLFLFSDFIQGKSHFG